jgi:hypothetical protein
MDYMPKASGRHGVSFVCVVMSALAFSATARADGTITGQVVNASGTPLSGICVYYAGAPYAPPDYPVLSAQTDANGDYSIALSPGPYLIEFQGCGEDYVGQYYPGQPAAQTAGTVTVVDGQVTSGINAQMAVGGTITGRVLDQETGSPPAQSDINITAQMLGSNQLPIMYPAEAAASPDADGNYTLTGLAPGSYVVYFYAEPSPTPGVSDPYASAWYPDEPDFEHATVVSVLSGQTTPLGVELAEDRGTVTGRVTDVAGAPLAGYFISAYIAEANGSQFPSGSFPVTTGADGTFTITGLAPGTWTISAFQNGAGQYIQTQSAIVQPGANTPNVDFTYCVGTECPPTHLLALRTQIQNHELAFSGQVSDPGHTLLNVVLTGRVGRHRVHIRGIDYPVAGGSFRSALSFPRPDWALRSGSLTLDFAPSQAATGGRFVVSVPGGLPRTPSKPTPAHKPKPKHKHKHRPKPDSKRRHKHSK